MGLISMETFLALGNDAIKTGGEFYRKSVVKSAGGEYGVGAPVY
jgi:hypothetical protein